MRTRLAQKGRGGRGAVLGLDALRALSLALGGVRWAFMPLGLFALVAVGVHAAADRVDDSVRFLLVQVDAGADALWGSFSWTEAWVEGVGERECTWAARALALVWELAVALVAGWPALGYAEEERPGSAALVWNRRWRDALMDVWRRPTLLRVTRPLATTCFVLAGVVAVGQMLQASVFQGTAEVFGGGLAVVLARGAALVAMTGVLASLGLRAILRQLQHTDAQARLDEARPVAARWLHGLPGTVVTLPLAAAALVATAPLLGFFR